MNTVQKKYGMLRFISGLLKVLAWLSLVFGLVGAVVTFIGGFSLPMLPGVRPGGTSDPLSTMMSSGMIGILVGFLTLLMSILYFITLYAASEQINLQIALEHNTRATADLLNTLVARNQLGQSGSTGIQQNP